MAHYWFIARRTRQSTMLALFTFGLAFIVILLGAYTRLTNAGLSCPDWPHCYGFITAPHTTAQLQDAAQRYPTAPIDITKAWTEMTHRYFAGTEAILILILSYTIFFNNKIRNSKSIIIGSALIGLLLVQILLGMLTVTAKLKPVIVLSHLLTGISILSVLWWAYLNLQTSSDQFRQKTRYNFVPWLWGAFIVVFAQITLGGWVTTHYAGLACVDFPYCNGQVLPTLRWDNLNTDLITIHMLHRIGAMATAVYIGAVAYCLMTTQAMRANGIFLFSLLALQLTLGILNIVWLRPIWIALLHQAVAILLLLTVITALVKAYLCRENHYGSRIA